MKVLGIARLLAEAGVVIGQKTGQQFIAGGDRADPAKTQFLDQAILQGPVGTLNPALGLARIGTDDVDVQRMQRPAELGHAVAFDRARAVDPEDAVLVAVECDRLALRLDVVAHPAQPLWRDALAGRQREMPDKTPGDADAQGSAEAFDQDPLCEAAFFISLMRRATEYGEQRARG